MSDLIARKILELQSLDAFALRARWQQAFGRPAPKGISQRLLRYALAYEAQARAWGGLRPATMRKLLDYAHRSGSAEAEPRLKPRGTPSPGARLVREWHGHVHVVEVAADGCIYEGKRYRSLSEVARAITGARWSGPRFFGL